MKSDLPTRWFRQRRKKRQELLVNISQSRVVFQQRFIDFCQAFQDRGVCRDFFAYFDKGADDVDAHRDGTFASEYICCLKGAVFGKCPRAIFPVLAAPRL